MHTRFDCQAVLDGLANPVAVLNRAGSVEYANAAFRRASGCDEIELSVNRLPQVWPAFRSLVEDARYLHAIGTGTAARFEPQYDLEMPAGSPRYEIQIQPLGDGCTSLVFHPLGITPADASAPPLNPMNSVEHPHAALHARMLADMGACLRAELSAAETFYQVASILGKLPGVSRATFGTVDNQSQTATIHRDYCRGVPSMVGTYRMCDAEITSQELGRGQIVVISDVVTDYRSRDAAERRFKLAYRACVAIPLMRDDVWAATLMVQSPVPREWSADEVELIRTAAERTWLSVENVRLLHEARDANAAKDQFLAVLSHELRTPLTPVVITLNSLQDNELVPPEAKADLAMIRRNINLETQLIDDLLDVTRIANGKLRLTFRPTRVHELLQHVCQICSEDARNGSVDLNCEFGAAVDTVMADAARLEQVFWNLLKNAIKFTPAGGQVRVATSERDGKLLVEVLDTGAGISPELLPRIFNSFEQGEQSVTRTFGGLGLGLAISKGIVDLHGGKIAAASGGPGQGATLSVLLPLKIPEPLTNGNAGSPGAQAYDSGRLASLRVLLVDDHADTLRVMKRTLASWGMHVTTACRVEDAVRAAAAEKFDLLISDIGLPDGSGCDLVEQLRQLQPITAIALSGFGMDADVRRSMEAGFAAHLVKPTSLDQLADVIAELMADQSGSRTSPSRESESRAALPN